MRKFIYSYKSGSASARDLARALRIKRVKHVGSAFRPRANKLLINWGASSDVFPDNYLSCRVINSPTAVGRAANKLTFFRSLQGTDVSHPEFLTSRQDVIDSLDGSENLLYFARTKLTGHSGQGIVPVYGNSEEVPQASLYTRYMKKKFEYRVHVFNGRVIDTQRKARNTEVADEDVNWQVRNHSNGFIFARNEGHEVPQCVLDESVKAVGVCGLDFGAVDVIYNDRSGLAYVIEVNTAPGLAGTTLDNYVRAFSGV